MSQFTSRREFLRHLGIGAAAVPFVLNLPSLGLAAPTVPRRQRLVIMFSPNGVVPKNFWPDEEGEKFTLKESLNRSRRFRSEHWCCTASQTKSAATAITTCGVLAAC